MNIWFFNLAAHVHLQLRHAGEQTTWTELRQQFWIPQGRQLVKGQLRRCGACRKRDARPFAAPPMAALPATRVTPTRPFDHVGLDYFGPCTVRSPTEPTQAMKIWVAVFTCFVTRAVHLEVVHSLSGSSCLAALRRFFSRRGRPSSITSDNATTFQLASSAVRTAWPELQLPPAVTDALDEHCTNNGITWSNIVAHAPWQGGVWERIIGVIKQPLKSSIGRSWLHLEEFTTLLAEVEFTINSRPLTHSSAAAPEVFRPLDFLLPLGTPSVIPTTLTTPPQAAATTADLLALWRDSHQRLETFWQHYRSVYLMDLRDRSERLLHGTRYHEPRIPVIDEVVLMLDDAVPRNQWRIGRVVALHDSADAAIRSATVRMANGRTVRRPVNKLAPLEFAVDSPAITSDSTPVQLDRSPSPTAAAAPEARRRRGRPRKHPAPLPAATSPEAAPPQLPPQMPRYELRPRTQPRALATTATVAMTLSAWLPRADALPLVNAPVITDTFIFGPVGYACLILLTLILCCTTIGHLMTVFNPLAIVCRLVLQLLSLPLRLLLWLVCRNPRSARRRVIFALCLLFLPGGEGAVCTTSNVMSTYAAQCTDSGCSHFGEARLTLRDVGQRPCLLLLDSNDTVHGQIALALHKPQLLCRPRHMFDTRSYKTATAAVQRCPASGSCVLNTCAEVKANDHLPEFDNVNQFPGTTSCVNGPEWIFTGCALPTPSCIFYRLVALPEDDTRAISIYRCDEWASSVQVIVELTTRHTTESTRVRLYDGVPTTVSGNITVTLNQALQTPGEVFLLRRGQEWAIAPSLDAIRLRRSHGEELFTFQPRCGCQPTATTVNCLCEPDPPLQAWLDDALPTPWTTGLLHSTPAGPAFRPDQATVELEVSIAGWHLASSSAAETNCTITVGPTLTAATGEAVTVLCSAPEEEQILVECGNEVLVVECNTTTAATMITLPVSDDGEVRCSARCAGVAHAVIFRQHQASNPYRPLAARLPTLTEATPDSRTLLLLDLVAVGVLLLVCRHRRR